MRIGTSYFATHFDACAYYRKQGFAVRDVKAKLDAGEIHVGRPPLKPGERAELIPGENRYSIETGDA